MTAADTEAMTAVRALLDERQRYQGWIQGLDAHRASASPHVYERVRADYMVRLEGVNERLSTHADQLRSTVDDLSARHEQLKQREFDRQEARQEAELRAAVGEYAEEEWNRLRDDADLEILAVVEERQSVEAELVELQRIMRLTSGAPDQANDVAAANGAPERDLFEAAPATQPEVVAAHGSVESASAETSVVANANANASASPSMRPQAGVLAATASSEPNEPSIEAFIADWPLKQVGENTPSVSPAQTNAAPSAPREVHAAAVGQVAASTPMFSAPPLEAPAEAPTTEMRRDQEKTLKCPECATMNYATEWYCERCGGELATY